MAGNWCSAAAHLTGPVCYWWRFHRTTAKTWNHRRTIISESHLIILKTILIFLCNFFVSYYQTLHCWCCSVSYGVKGNFSNQFLFFLPLTTQGSTLFFHGPAICNCIHLFDSHSLMFAAECAGQWKASGQKRGEADEHNSALIARLIWCECNHGVICLKWRGPFDPSSCECVRVGVCMLYHQLPGAIKSGIRSRGKQDVLFFLLFCVCTRKHICLSLSIYT